MLETWNFELPGRCDRPVTSAGNRLSSAWLRSEMLRILKSSALAPKPWKTHTSLDKSERSAIWALCDCSLKAGTWFVTGVAVPKLLFQLCSPKHCKRGPFALHFKTWQQLPWHVSQTPTRMGRCALIQSNSRIPGRTFFLQVPPPPRLRRPSSCVSRISRFVCFCIFSFEGPRPETRNRILPTIMEAGDRRVLKHYFPPWLNLPAHFHDVVRSVAGILCV